MQFDFVIVGGGVYGLATAYHLARLGAASVAVLERGEPASGASGGLGQRGVRANRRDLREIPLMREANEVWPTLAEELGAETGYRRTGGCFLIEDTAAKGFSGIDAARPLAEVQTALGVPTEVWDRDRVRSVYPGVADAVEAAAYVPTDGVASHEATTLAYASAARRLGVQVLTQTGVEAVEMRADGRVSGVVTATGEVVGVGRELLLTANTDTPRLVAQATGAVLPVWTIHPQAARLRSATPAHIPMLTGHDTRTLSVKMVGEDIMLSGGWRGRRTATGVEVVEERVRGNVAELQAVFPELTDLEVLEVDVSRAESVSADRIPIIGRCAPNLSVATGWTGHGWAIAPVVSRLIAESVLTGSDPSLLDPFTPRRFG